MWLILVLGVFFSTLLIIRYWKSICFQWKFIYFLLIDYVVILVLSPTTLRKPGDVENNILPSKCITFLMKITGIKYELRGLDHFAADIGCVMVLNHQQMVDVTGVLSHASIVKRFSIAIKKTMLYHPGGLLSALYGIVFVDRAGGSKSHQAVNSWAFKAKNQKFKVYIHPEGTRNFEGLKSQCLLPFKKGCFHAAVAAQIPIMPAVFSPYYFINRDRKICGRGRVILEALPPIPTTGMTGADVDGLILKTRTLMTIKYRQLTKEVLSTLPLNHPVFEWINDVD